MCSRKALLREEDISHCVHIQRAKRATVRSRPTRYMLSKRGGLTSPPDTATRKANNASLGLRASSSISALVVTSMDEMLHSTVLIVSLLCWINGLIAGVRNLLTALSE